MSWTEERVELLKKLWGEGYSASMIATNLGNVTRNAVIGKVHRMGLANREVAAADAAAVEAAKAAARAVAEVKAAEEREKEEARQRAKARAEARAERAKEKALAKEREKEENQAQQKQEHHEKAAPHQKEDLQTTAHEHSPEKQKREPKKAEPTAAPAPRSLPPAVRKIIPAGQPLPPQPSANEVSPEALAKVSEVEKTAKKLTLMELTERTCKWPIGDPATKNFWFCGLATKVGKPYCEAHVGVAFQPMTNRRDRRR